MKEKQKNIYIHILFTLYICISLEMFLLIRYSIIGTSIVSMSLLLLKNIK